MKIFGASDIGTMRNNNQDAFINTVLSSNAVLSVVCDGMGGANAGNVASSIAVNTITEYVKRSFTPDIKSSSAKNLLVSAIESANSEIFEQASNNSHYNGMGTTAVVALVVGNTAFLSHVGDSRAYLVSKDEAVQLTKDHSMIQTLIENGHLTAEEAQFHPKRNVITRAIGTQATVDIDFAEIDLTNECLLLCTDGISNVIQTDELVSAVENTVLEDLPEALIKLANERDSGDNVTVTVVKID